MLELETAFAELFLSRTVNEATRVDVLVGKTAVRAEKVRFYSAWRLHRHLGSVLQDVDRELGTRHAGQPDTEVLVYLEDLQADMDIHIQTVQEAQLPLRKRASAMYFFIAKLLSIAVMTYSYVYHLRSLRPMIRLIYYAYSK